MNGNIILLHVYFGKRHLTCVLVIGGFNESNEVSLPICPSYEKTVSEMQKTKNWVNFFSFFHPFSNKVID